MNLKKIKEMKELGLIKSVPRIVKPMSRDEVLKFNESLKSRNRKYRSSDEILKIDGKSKIAESNKTYSYQEPKKNKIYEFLKNALIMIVFVTIVYLGSSSNSNGERYEGGKDRGVHR